MIIEGRTFVISGGASGLGRATAYDLYQNGGSVAILDMNEDIGEEFVKELGTDRARFCHTDVTDTESIKTAVSDINQWTQQTGRSIGAVINAAGVGAQGKIISRKGEPLPLSHFDFVMNINLRGTIDLCRQLLPSIIANEPLHSSNPGLPSTETDGERGVLVLVSSVAAYDGQPGQTAYAASKGAIGSIVLPMARDLAEHGVRVVAIAPGVFESPMTSLMSAKVRKSLEGVMEFPKRMGRPDEFARLVREVVGNNMINATTIRIDGAVRMPSKM